MSKTIDERVVEMRFDNRQFEANVATSMGTLEKLKKSLKFDGATKSLEDIDKASKKVDFNHMARNSQAALVKISHVNQTIQHQIDRIADRIADAGTRMLKSLTVDQITTGFSKLEQKTSSVQTIMNATGKTVQEVGGYLDKLMWYSDETSYGFTDMTASLAQLTSAGGDIDKLIPLIEGVANATAFAGKGANEFSRAIYNLNQSYSAGYLQMMDWRSLELAGVASKQLKQVLIDTAVEEGKVEAGMIDISNFSTTLKDKWADTTVMEKGFGKFAAFTEAAYKLIEENDYVDNASDAYRILAGDFNDTALAAYHLTDAQKALIGTFDENVVAASKAAQQAKSFTEAIDATKDAVSSSFMRMFEYVLGDLNEQIEIWSELCDGLYDMFVAPLAESGGIEEILGGAMTSKWIDPDEVTSRWGELEQQIEATGMTVSEFEGKVAETLSNNGYDVDEILSNYASLSEAVADEAVSFTTLRESIYYLDDVTDEAKADMNAFLDSLIKTSGRELVIDSVRNILSSIVSIINTIKGAWRDVFPAKTSLQLYGLIERFHNFTESMKFSEEELGNLRSAFAGLFSIVGIVGRVVGGVLTTGFKLLSAAIGIVGGSVLGLVGKIGDLLSAFSNWIAEAGIIDAAVRGIGTAIAVVTGAIGLGIAKISNVFTAFTDKFKSGIQSVKDFFENLKASIKISDLMGTFKTKISNVFTTFTDKFKSGIQFIKEFISNVKELTGVSFNGLKSSISSVIHAGLDKLKGIKLPSLDFKAFKDSFSSFTKFLASGDFKGIKGLVTGTFEFFKSKITTKLDTFKNNTILAFADFYNKHGDKIEKGISVFKKVINGIVKFVFGSLDSVNLQTIASLVEKFMAIKALTAVTKVLDNITEAFESIGGALNNFAKAQKWKAVSAAMVTMGVVLAEVILGIFVITQLLETKGDTVYKSLAILGGILLAIGVVIGTLTAISGKFGNGMTMVGAAAMILGLAGGIAVLVAALVAIDKLEFDHLGRSMAILGGTLLSLVVAISVMSKFAGGATTKSALAIVTLLTAVKMIPAILEQYDKFDWASVSGAIPKLLAMLLALSVAMRIATGGMKSNANSAGMALLVLAMVASLKLMLGVISDLAAMDTDSMWQGILGTLALIGGITLMTAAVGRLSGDTVVLKKGERSANNFKGLAMALLSVVASIYILGKMDVGTLKQGGVAVIVIMAVMSTVMAVTGKASSKAKTGTIIAMLVGFGAIMAEMYFLIQKLSANDWSSNIGAAVSLGLLLGAVVGCFKLLTAGTNVNLGTAFKLVGALAALGVVVAGLAGILGLLRVMKVDGGEAITQVAALSILLGAMSVCMSILNFDAAFKTTGIFTMIGAMAALGVVVAGLAGILGLLRVMKVDGGEAILQVEALSILLGAMTMVMAALTALGIVALPLGTGILAGEGLFAVLGVIVTGLAGILGLLRVMKVDGGEAILQVEAIVNLMKCMEEVLAVCTAVGIVAGTALAGLGVLGAAIIGLGVVIAAFAAIGAGIDSKLGDGTTEAALDKAVMIFTKIGEALGGLVGGVIGGLADGAMDGIVSAMEKLGTGLSNFMDNAGVFFTGMDKMKSDTPTKAAIIGDVIESLTKSSIIDGITSFGRFKDKFTQLGTDLSSFMDNASGFFAGIDGLDLESTLAADRLVDIIGKLTTQSLLDGIVSFFTGGNTFESFGESLSSLGTGLVSFATATQGIEEVSGGLGTAFDALDQLISLSKKIPNSGGWAGTIFGENDADTFGNRLKAFGEGIVNFATATQGIDEVSGGTEQAIDLAGDLIALSKKIPNSGGRIGGILGDNDIDKFGKKLREFGEGLYSFAEETTDIDSVAGGTDTALAIADTLITMANNLPADGGWYQTIFGSQSLDDFGKKAKNFGEGLTDFATAVQDIPMSENINTAFEYGTKLIEMANSLPESGGLKDFFSGTTDLDNFGHQLATFAQGIVDFADSVDGINGKKSETLQAIVIGKKLLEMANTAGTENGLNWFVVNSSENLAEVFSGLETVGRGIAAFSTAIEGVDTSETNIDYVTKMLIAIQTIESLDFLKVGNTIRELNGVILPDLVSMVAGLDSVKESAYSVSLFDRVVTGFESLTSLDVSGIDTLTTSLNSLSEISLATIAEEFENGGETLSESVSTMLADAVEALSDNSGFYDAGVYMVEGFAKGITDGTYLAVDAATSMVDAAAEATNAAAEIASPSRLFMRIAGWIPKGFAKGITKNLGIVSTSGVKMADSFEDSFRDTMGIHSPAKTTEEDAANAVAGFTNSIDKGRPDVERSGAAMAQSFTRGMDNNVSIEKFSKEFIGGLGEIKDAAVGFVGGLFESTDGGSGSFRSIIDNFIPPKDEVEEVGSGMVDGIAGGITDNKAAEKAAEDKANAIVEAFKDQFDRATKNLESYDLEYKLWEAANPNATEVDINAAKIETVTKNIAAQTELANIAQQKYNQTFAELGPDAIQTQERYNEWVSAMTQLITYQNELNALQAEANKSNNEAGKRYLELLKEASDNKLLEFGFTQEEIDEWAREQSGYGKEAAKSVTETVAEILGTSLEPITSTIGNIGLTIADSLTSPDTASSVSKSFSEIAKNGLSMVESSYPEWKSAGATIVDNFVDGIKDNILKIKDVAMEMANTVIDTIVDKFQSIPDSVLSVFGAFAETGMKTSTNDSHTSIAPVATIEGTSTNLRLTDRLATSFNGPVDRVSRVLGETQASIEASNREVVNAISALRDDFSNAYASDGREIGLYVDGKKLASSLARPMNYELNILTSRRAY